MAICGDKTSKTLIICSRTDYLWTVCEPPDVYIFGLWDETGKIRPWENVPTPQLQQIKMKKGMSALFL